MRGLKLLIGTAAAVATLTPIGGGEASAACAVSSSLRQTDASQVSDSVKCLQQTLNDRGFNSGPVDGWFGPVTHGAVVAYQQANGLTVDGWVGRQTRNSLGIVANFGGGGGQQQQQQSQPRQQTQQQAAPARSQNTGSSSSSGGGGSVWDRLAQCESGGNWSINTGNGYYGGLQFLASTWRANGGTGLPHQNSREEQIRVAENLRSQAGFAPWPACSRKLGLR
jgi:peptidoglycan hydrolase-like protein with peptidoglycan-binding domain